MRKSQRLSKAGCLMPAGFSLVAFAPELWAADATWPKRVAIMGGVPGSTYYTCDTGMGEVLKKYLNVDAMIMAATGGSTPLIPSVKEGEADIVIRADGGLYSAPVVRNYHKANQKADNLCC